MGVGVGVGVGVPPSQAAVPAGTEIALKVAATPWHSALLPPYSSFAELIAPLRASA